MMNQIKIGAFISERRKAKGWTQSQLAEKLEITDKAVSKWETGDIFNFQNIFGGCITFF